MPCVKLITRPSPPILPKVGVVLGGGIKAVAFEGLIGVDAGVALKLGITGAEPMGLLGVLLTIAEMNCFEAPAAGGCVVLGGFGATLS